MAKVEVNLSSSSCSRISEGTVVKGDIITPNDIRIDGQFEGKLISKGRVYIGETAKVTSDVICENMEMCGSICGNIYVRDVLSLREACVVDGNIAVRRLEVEADARLNGNCKMITEAEFDQIVGVTAEGEEAAE